MWEVVLFICAWTTYIVLFLQYQKERRERGEYVQNDNTVSRQEMVYQDTSLFASLGLSGEDVSNFVTFTDRFSNFDQIIKAMKQAGLQTCQLMIGIDFTASNEWQGRKTYSNKCLHHLSGQKIVNPYQKVISIIGGTLEKLDSDSLIPAYGFGDTVTKNTGIFPLRPDGAPCRGFGEVLLQYNETTSRISLSGPTSFAPIINKAIETVQQTQLYHLLLIVTDGQLKNQQPSIDAIIDASNYALSIIVVGVGDGPWTTMEHYDDMLPNRKFDNFQFVNFHKVCAKAKYAEPAFALNSLMEIPDQYKAICSLGYLNPKMNKRD
ncbi:uncharacterized protein [Ptychodera flava]|uniref:uncharacterized protein n=1 Tax=Ptychodera flava TaxID=63121 RepID=UPI00396A7CA9